MDWLTWILIGGVIGLIATRVGRGAKGARPLSFVMGLAGAVLGGLAMSKFGVGLVADPLAAGALAALAGALLAIVLQRRLRRRGSRRGSFVGPFYAP